MPISWLLLSATALAQSVPEESASAPAEAERHHLIEQQVATELEELGLQEAIQSTEVVETIEAALAAGTAATEPGAPDGASSPSEPPAGLPADIAAAAVATLVEARFQEATGLQLAAGAPTSTTGAQPVAPKATPTKDPHLLPPVGVLERVVDAALLPASAVVDLATSDSRRLAADAIRADREANRAERQAERAEIRSERRDPLGLVHDAGAFLIAAPRANPLGSEPVAQQPDVDLLPPTEEDTDRFGAVVAVGRLGAWACTGTIVARRIVLTAAHCLPAEAVLAGVKNTAATGLVASVVATATHPTGLDVALLALDRNIQVPTPIWRLPGEDLAPGDLTIVGFGEDDRGRAGTRKELRVRAETWGCDGVSAVAFGCRPGQELALTARHGADTCVGDSGGPVFEDVGTSVRIVGVTSRAIRNARVQCGDGGVYTRMDAVSDWLVPAIRSMTATLTR